MRTSRLAALVAFTGAAALSCATPAEPAYSGPPPFTGVKKIALVRVRADGGEGARAKGVLDALAESLSARGYEVSRTEVGPNPPADLRGLERLHATLDGLIGSGQPRSRLAHRAESVGGDAGEAVRSLGVDAVAMAHRFGDRLLPPLPDPGVGGSLFPARPETQGLRRPLGALSLVDRSGNATWFAWGAPGGELDPTQPVNAAEAIDMLLRALRGETEEE